MEEPKDERLSALLYRSQAHVEKQTEKDVEGCRYVYLSCIVAWPIVPVATSSSPVTPSLLKYRVSIEGRR